MNGDLSKDFPLARKLALDEKKFKVIVFDDKGFLRCYQQVLCCWRSTFDKDNMPRGVRSFYADDKLAVEPAGNNPYMINIDGLGVMARGKSTFFLKDKISLISG